jgi:hypothetical protein
VTPALREAAFQRVKGRVEAWQAASGLPPGSSAGLCLHYARFGLEEVAALPGKPRVCVQAGSAFWPRVPVEQDDGITSLNFGYQFDARHPLTLLALAGVLLGRGSGAALPEMHVWLGLPDSQELIDFTAGQWPVQCQALLGEPWLTPTPPDFLWCPASELPERVYYRPQREATLLAGRLIHQLRQQG